MSEKNKKRFGLLGRNIAYSFSRVYFTEKFEREKRIYCQYENFDLPNLDNFEQVLKSPYLKGMNVTIPYKEDVIPFLDEIDEVALDIGAVNTIVFYPDGTTKGYNTDYIGFRESVTPLLSKNIKGALILGTGGASKAIVYTLHRMGIQTQYISRKRSENAIAYEDITKEIMQSHQLIVNCSPVGTFPQVDAKPNIDYSLLTSQNVLFDLIYNPNVTAFMREGLELGAKVSNGKNMLVRQAEAAWKLWNR